MISKRLLSRIRNVEFRVGFSIYEAICKQVRDLDEVRKVIRLVFDFLEELKFVLRHGKFLWFKNLNVCLPSPEFKVEEFDRPSIWGIDVNVQ